MTTVLFTSIIFIALIFGLYKIGLHKLTHFFEIIQVIMNAPEPSLLEKIEEIKKVCRDTPGIVPAQIHLLLEQIETHIRHD